MSDSVSPPPPPPPPRPTPTPPRPHHVLAAVARAYIARLPGPQRDGADLTPARRREAREAAYRGAAAAGLVTDAELTRLLEGEDLEARCERSYRAVGHLVEHLKFVVAGLQIRSFDVAKARHEARQGAAVLGGLLEPLFSDTADIGLESGPWYEAARDLWYTIDGLLRDIGVAVSLTDQGRFAELFSGEFRTTYYNRKRRLC